MKLSKFVVFSTIVGVGLILLALTLLIFAVQNSTEFDKYYIYLIVLSLAGLSLVVLVLLISLWRLFQQYRAGVSGSRLKLKLVGFFILATLIPTGLLYFFAIKLLNSGIDSWFDIHVAEALKNSQELGQTAVDERKKRLIRETHFVAGSLGPELEKSLLDMREKTNAYELTLFDGSGVVKAFVHADKTVLVPQLPPDAVVSQVKSGNEYHEAEEIENLGNVIRIIIKVPDKPGRLKTKDVYLNAIYQMPDRIDSLLENVNETSSGFQKANFLQPQLRQSFVITLSMVLFVALAAAIWLGLYLARRLAQPVMDLAQGTRQVAAGVYQKIPGAGRDELGFLVDSFNQMISRVDEAQLAQKRQRAFLDEVLTNLSSGVMVIDNNFILQRKNTAVEQILNIKLDKFLHQEIFDMAQDEEMKQICSNIKTMVESSAGNNVWELEQSIVIDNSSRVLNIKGRKLPEVSDLEGGTVIVFEDITERIKGQRNAAWAEVARRLAHEIKNPLTPIQLSAERIRDKSLAGNFIDDKNRALIERGTKTIISQVEALKKMVGDFSEFARSPKIVIKNFNLVSLVDEVAELYRPNPDVLINTSLKAKMLHADANRVRQLLHNIIKNTLEIEGKKPITVNISSEYNTEQDINIKICDDGGGIPENMLGNIFEPYITGKPKGTGLGLAIVKRIVEEHEGSIRVYNATVGVCFDIVLPDR